MLAEGRSERRGLLPRYTLKSDNTFLRADALGDIHSADDGLFTDDTRMLSRLEFLIAGRPPSLLGAAVDQRNSLFTNHLTNRPLPNLGEQVIPEGVIHISRNRFLHSGRVFEQIQFTNYGEDVAGLPVRFGFAADFADIFEVQGRQRPGRGRALRPVLREHCIGLGYEGLDSRVRTTSLSFSRMPSWHQESEAHLSISIAHGERIDLYLEVDTAGTDAQPVPGPERYAQVMQEMRESMRSRLEQGASVSTSGRLFNAWIEKSRADLALLTTDLATGPYPYAGIPWFATPFGRDALITALQTLWINPELAQGVLRFLANTQATVASELRDAEPGKILHEMRRGEMAALNEVPFGCYYGAVDSTPLFVMLAGEYEARTGDRSLADEIWAALQRAVGWIERRLEQSPSGFLDYLGSRTGGLINQAWKDSQDSIFHASGAFPQPPIAVVEVQGYAYAAFRAMAEMSLARGDIAEADRLNDRAQKLRAAIEECFWLPDMGFYAVAIDGTGQACRIRASNVGHLLFCQVPTPGHAAQVIEHLLGRDFSSGWGIRTLASGQIRFNPMSYHNGSIWPHDTAMCAAGMAKYGKRLEVLRLLGDVFEAASHFEMRLPELYCGFERVEGQSPTPYPVACLPQSWAAGSVFMLLQACLGVHIDGRRREIRIESPLLPIGIEALTVRGCPFAEVRIDIRFYRLAEEVMVAAEGADDVAVLVHAGARHV